MAERWSNWWAEGASRVCSHEPDDVRQAALRPA